MSTSNSMRFFRDAYASRLLAERGESTRMEVRSSGIWIYAVISIRVSHIIILQASIFKKSCGLWSVNMCEHLHYPRP